MYERTSGMLRRLWIRDQNGGVACSRPFLPHSPRRQPPGTRASVRGWKPSLAPLSATERMCASPEQRAMCTLMVRPTHSELQDDRPSATRAVSTMFLLMARWRV
jgi:hypothetical protein